MRTTLKFIAVFSKIVLFSLPLLSILFPAAAAPLLAQTKSQTNAIYDPSAMTITLRTISMAAETYAADKKKYPKEIAELTNADPPYLSEEYCHETIWGYTYDCSFSVDGYVITATPLSDSPLDAPVLAIRTTGILETPGSDKGKNTEPDFSFSLKDFWSLSQIDKYKRFLQQDPGNNQLRLVLANLYAGHGDGKTAQTLALEIISSNPGDVVLKKAYHTLLLSYYLQVDLEQGLKKSQEVLEIYPDSETAVSFKKLFQGLLDKRASGADLVWKQGSPWEESLPLKSSQPAADDEEILPAQGIGGVSSKAGEEDFVILDSGRIFFTAPVDWQKGANVQSARGDSLLLYSKARDSLMPVISIMADVPPKGVETALAYAKWIKDLTQQQFPFLEFSDPKEKTIAGRQGAYGELTVQSNNDRSSWYQFWINGKILTVQYSNTGEAFAADYPAFEAVVSSMKLEE